MSVAAVGDTDGDGYQDLLVGAPSHAPGGKAYLYRGGAGGVSTTASWSDVGTQSGEGFGRSVSGGIVDSQLPSLLIGAPNYSSMQRTHDGAAFFYVVPAGSPPVLDTMVAVGASNDHVGWSVAHLETIYYRTSGIAVGAPDSAPGGTVTTWSYHQ